MREREGSPEAQLGSARGAEAACMEFAASATTNAGPLSAHAPRAPMSKAAAVRSVLLAIWPLRRASSRPLGGWLLCSLLAVRLTEP